MAAVVTIEAVAIVLLGLLVVGLLRSHAEILRVLHQMGAGLDPDVAAAAGVTSPVPTPVRRSSATAFDVSGTTPTDEAARIGVVGARQSTVLAFLSSGCLTCGSFWETFGGTDRLAVPGGARLVVVTKSPDSESQSRIRELAPTALPVVMSTEAWVDYKVPHTPYFVYVDGPSGRIVGEGSAQTWAQVVSLWSQALADDAVARGGGEARADRELLQAGIHPGHESLYPTPAATEK
ncbi:MAG TPA: hypothetical protein VHT97_12305 [Acidimicrobiales bacterium]|jgi:hypothetical protein|nr:hypothetical protein [Acidimicrobiales bacterium]